MKHELEWFKERIGKQIFRMPILSSDEEKVLTIIPSDDEHVRYLFTCQSEIEELHYWDENDSIIHNAMDFQVTNEFKRQYTVDARLIFCPRCSHVHWFNIQRWKITYENGLPTITPSLDMSNDRFASVDSVPCDCHFTINKGRFKQNDKIYWLYGW